jgi:hypothetical protein
MKSFYKKILTVLFLALLVPTAAARGGETVAGGDATDTVAVQGQRLKGWIRLLDSEGVTLDTAYGKGKIKIDYQDIEQISSQRPFRIYYGEDHVVQGQILGIEKGLLSIGMIPESAVSIKAAAIITGLALQEYETSWLRRMRTDFRHWNANLALGWRYERTAVDKNKLEFGLRLARRKSPTRLVFDFRYAYEIQKSSGGVEATTKDELMTYLLGEYDVRDQWFLFARPAIERDRPRLIEQRLYPAAGIGYRFYVDKNYLLQLPFGFGYVDEEFIGFGENTYTAGYIGFEGLYTFKNGVTISCNLLLMPGLDDPGEERLFRFDFDFKLPIVDPVALLFRFTSVNDNNPDPEVGDNKFTTFMALSIDF